MEYLKKMKEIQNEILIFLDNEEEEGKNFDDLSKLLNIQPKHHDIHELESILNLISKIANNHHRGPFFFDKIEKIISLIKDEIKQTFSNVEIFNFFKDNKRILLLLINEDILTIDSTILAKVHNFKEYFYTEITKLNEETIEIPENYEEKRLKGENDSYLCELIRNDDVEKFIILYNKNSFSLSMSIQNSIYETNPIFIEKTATLIEYAAFYGSIQIFRYLIQNQVDLAPSLYLYSIHSQNPEIIQLLEENEIYPNDKSYQECLKEAIKCHHNDFADYFKNNFIMNESDVHSNYFVNEFYYGFQFYNFQYIPIEIKEPFFFYYAIECNYYNLVEYYKDIEGLNINEKVIF